MNTFNVEEFRTFAESTIDQVMDDMMAQMMPRVLARVGKALIMKAQEMYEEAGHPYGKGRDNMTRWCVEALEASIEQKNRDLPPHIKEIQAMMKSMFSSPMN